MKIKHLLTVVATVAITNSAFAQYSQDAIRFSTFQNGATSRIKAIGNATTAVGGDLSNVSANPAGLGFFTRSELSITPEYNSQKANTGYFNYNSANNSLTSLGSAGTTNTNTLNFNNAAGVLYGKLNTPAGSKKDEGWLSLNFGASYDRTNDFYQGIYYSGANAANSITNYYAKLANSAGGASTTGTGLQDFAYAHNLIDAYSSGTGSTYLSNVFNNRGAANQAVQQNNSIIREGGQTEINLAMGANYSNKFYLGFGIGLTSIRYNSINTFNEAGLANVYVNSTTTTNSNYNSSYVQNQATTGAGFNARLGFIYKPEPFIRFGGTVTTPTWYTVNDDYTESLTTRFTSGVTGSYFGGPTDYQLNYNFHTPWKVSGGLAIFLGKFGFITGDIDYLDYSSVRIADNADYSVKQDNSDIKTLYRSTVNTHMGAEIKLDQLYLRGGYGIQGNPQRNFGGDLKTASGGIGYRFMDYYVDVTYTNVQGNQTLFPYGTDATLTATSPQANVSNTYNNVFLTVGMRF